MQLLRRLRLWGLGASAGLIAWARAPGASRYHRPPPRPRAPPASPRPRLRPRVALSPESQRPAVVACRDPSPATAACMELPGAGELGRAVWGDWSLGAWARLGRGEGPASRPACAPSAWSAIPPPPFPGAPLPALRGIRCSSREPDTTGHDQCCLSASVFVRARTVGATGGRECELFLSFTFLSR